MKSYHFFKGFRTLSGKDGWGYIQYIGSLFLFLLVWLLIYSPGFSVPTAPSSPMENLELPRTQASLAVEEENFAPPMTTIHERVKKGDTASSILNAYLPLKTIYKLDAQSRKVFPLTRIRRGQAYSISLLEDSLEAFEYEINSEDRLVIQKEGDEFSLSRQPIEYDIERAVVAADIKTTLSHAMEDVGEGSSLAVKLAEIFAWDIDFLRDIKSGDSLKVLVEKRYKRDTFVGYGRVLAAIIENKGRIHEAFHHGENNYYTREGHSLKKAFLKAPLNYSRISSKFSKRRFHPILKRHRAHLGVDYAAPRNTPIKAVGDGTIIRMGYGKGAGRFITIRHPNGYETSYFHMNKFAKGMKRWKKVTQGKVIGYVGKTGLATGYHLCFRMRRNGKPVNPLGIDAPVAAPIPPDEREAFSRKVLAYSRNLDAGLQMALSPP